MSKSPLADRLRPRNLSEYLGQQQIVGEGKFLRQALDKGTLPSLILWGPPGTGKTTLALILASAACSVIGGGKSKGMAERIPAGTVWAIKSSSVSAPTTVSIAGIVKSSGPI